MKKRTTATSIDEYIALYPPDVQARLEKIRATIRKAAPQARERISYQIPTFSLCGNLVHFAAYEHHIGFYPGASAVKHFKKELAPYASAKGSVQFPLDRPVPLGLIAQDREIQGQGEPREVRDGRRAKKKEEEILSERCRA